MSLQEQQEPDDEAFEPVCDSIYDKLSGPASRTFFFSLIVKTLISIASTALAVYALNDIFTDPNNPNPDPSQLLPNVKTPALNIFLAWLFAYAKSKTNPVAHLEDTIQAGRGCCGTQLFSTGAAKIAGSVTYLATGFVLGLYLNLYARAQGSKPDFLASIALGNADLALTVICCVAAACVNFSSGAWGTGICYPSDNGNNSGRYGALDSGNGSDEEGGDEEHAISAAELARRRSLSAA